MQIKVVGGAPCVEPWPKIAASDLKCEVGTGKNAGVEGAWRTWFRFRV